MHDDREYIGSDATIAGDARSIWLATAETTAYPRLEGEIEADVVVIGGGLVGALTADRLATAGLDVVLLEARRLCGSASGHTTAKATVEHDAIYSHLESRFGPESARLYAEANAAGLDHIERLASAEGVDCDFARVPFFLYATDDEAADQLRHEAEAAQRAGVPARYATHVPSAISVTGAVQVDGQAVFHPVRLVLGLLGQGKVRVHEHSRVVEIDDGEPAIVRTEAGAVRARHCVVATQFPVYDKGLFFSRLFPKVTYAYAGRSALLGDIAEMYHSFGDHPTTALRPFEGGHGSTLVLSGVEHKTGQGEDERAKYRMLSEVGASAYAFGEASHHWSTHDFATPDRVPYIGRSPWADHIYLAAGFGGWGMTNAAVSALLISDLVQGKENPWSELYAPNRVRPVASATPFIKENLNTAAHLVGGFLGGRPLDPENLRPGEGFVIRRGAKHYAVSRDDSGELTVLDASCTHMGCQVEWNEAEKTWDCPCHGSRYAQDGAVLYSPTVRALRPEHLPAED